MTSGTDPGEDESCGQSSDDRKKPYPWLSFISLEIIKSPHDFCDRESANNDTCCTKGGCGVASGRNVHQRDGNGRCENGAPHR